MSRYLCNRGVPTPRRAADLEIGDPAYWQPERPPISDLFCSPPTGFFVVQHADETSSLGIGTKPTFL